MALRSDAIETRLEGLRLDESRSSYDSKLRAHRRESKAQLPERAPISKPTKSAERDHLVDELILRLDEFSRRIDGLEQINRTLGQEIRHRGRQDHRWRSTSFMAVLMVSVLLYLGGHLRWF